MTRTPFVAALIVLGITVSESRTVPPRRPAGGHAAAPHAAAPHVAPHPSFSRPAVQHSFARPSAPHATFVPQRPVTRPAAPAVSIAPHSTAPHITNRPQIGNTALNRPTFNRSPVTQQFNRTTVNRPTNNETNVNRNVDRSRTVNRTNVYNSNPYTVNRFAGGAGGARYAGGGGGGSRYAGGYATAGRRWGGVGRQVGFPATWYSSAGNWGRSWWGDRPAWYWGRPWYWQHSGWHHGFWNYWSAPPALWFGAGLASGWLYSPYDTASYFNPYFVGVAENRTSPLTLPLEHVRLALNCFVLCASDFLEHAA